jgi:hypothetical protein
MVDANAIPKDAVYFESSEESEVVVYAIRSTNRFGEWFISHGYTRQQLVDKLWDFGSHVEILCFDQD